MQERLGLRIPDLETKNRAVNPNTGALMPHSVSSHRNGVFRENGNRFGQGTLFPTHIKSGDITKIERMVALEYYKFRKGRESKILSCQNAGGADRITMNLNRFGVKIIGSFVRRGSLCTVFPEESKERI
ncbi:MAG TPA: hypothetical protein PKZ92_01700 [Candidatus Woesebacteria bacterium]|jgi:hypothetical protein|nr:hypothetical protein [Candidatus Shapirobacteria bacterium]HOR01953.1 hypothetical protein [Candidatus Woesebacteria bacterium]HPL01595.1 hypothetical protein [bacterium]